MEFMNFLFKKNGSVSLLTQLMHFAFNFRNLLQKRIFTFIKSIMHIKLGYFRKVYVQKHCQNKKFAPKHKPSKEGIRWSCVVGMSVNVLWIENE